MQFSKQLSLWASGTGWRSYTDYIGGRVFYPGYSDDCMRGILSSKQVNKRIQEVTEKRLAGLQLPEGPEKEKKRRQIQDELKKEARRLSEGLVAKMDNVRFLRGFGVRLRSLSLSPLFPTSLSPSSFPDRPSSTTFSFGCTTKVSRSVYPSMRASRRSRRWQRRRSSRC